MVAAAERSALVIAALQRALADVFRLRAAEAAIGFRVLNIAIGRQSSALEITYALAHQPPQFFLAEAIWPATADAGRNRAEECVHERGHPRLGVAAIEISRHQPY